MRTYTTLLFFILITGTNSIICIEEKNTPIIINNNNNNNHNNKPKLAIIIKLSQKTINDISNAASAVANSISNSVNTISNTLKNKIKYYREQAADIIFAPFNWMYNNKFKTLFAGATIGCLYLNYYLFKTKYLLLAQHHWSLWNQTMELEALFAIPRHELGKNLAHAAQQRYTQAEDPQDFIGPLTRFMQDIETERLLLESYITMCRWIQRLLLAKIIWYDQNLLQDCEKRLTRLAYFKNAFSHWIAEYKFVQNNANLPAPAVVIATEG